LSRIDACVNINPRSDTQFALSCAESNDGREIALAAVRDNQVVGYALFSQVLDEATLLSIAVDPQHQRQGLGQLLLDTALTQMRTAGAMRCLLEVRQSNTAARTLYQRFGFSLDGVRKNYYPTQGGREDAVLMSKVLEG